jgi:hypothetical protein
MIDVMINDFSDSDSSSSRRKSVWEYVHETATQLFELFSLEDSNEAEADFVESVARVGTFMQQAEGGSR